MKRKNNISIIFLGIAILLASVTLGLLIIQQGNNVFGDISLTPIRMADFETLRSPTISLAKNSTMLTRSGIVTPITPAKLKENSYKVVSIIFSFIKSPHPGGG